MEPKQREYVRGGRSTWPFLKLEGRLGREKLGGAEKGQILIRGTLFFFIPKGIIKRITLLCAVQRLWLMN